MEITFEEIENHLNDSKKSKLETTVKGLCEVCNKPFTVSLYNLFRKKDFSEICHTCKLSKSKTVEHWEEIIVNNQSDIDNLIERIKDCKNPTAWKTTCAIFNCIECGKKRSVQLKSFIKYKSLVCSSCRSLHTNEEKYGYKTSFNDKDVQIKAQKSQIEKHGGVGLAATDIKKKAQNTNLEKYGSENPLSKGTIAYNKRNKTVKEVYGVDNVFQNNAIKEKISKTNLEKYGSENPFSSDVIKDKIIETNLSKYGVKYTQQNKDIRSKTESTNIERYGSKVLMGTDYFKNKSRETSMNRYGVPYPMMSKSISYKTKQTMIQRYGVASFSQTTDFAKCHRSSYTYDGIKFDSSWELIFYIYQIDHNNTISRCDKRLEYEYNGEKHFYFPDFIVNGKLYEIKGDQFWKEDGTMQNPYDHSMDGLFEAKHQCGLQNNVVFIRKNEIIEMNKYVIEKYTSDYIELFKESIEFPFLNQNFDDTSDFGLIRHFHKSIYYASKKGKLSPFDAWKDKALIKKSAINRLKYIGRCTPHDIIQGFNVASIAPKISVFKPTLAKRLIQKYLDGYYEIFDPFSGFSGRLIGSQNCNKKYIGQDINETHVSESNEIIAYKNYTNATVNLQDILTDTPYDYECLFTCPPYGGKEHWNQNNDEIEKSCDDWIDICLEKYKCKKYLFVVDKTEKYKDKIVETITNKSHFGTNRELVILI